MKDNFSSTFFQFLIILDTKVTKTGARKYLENHPQQESMMAYTDALNHFNIENAAAKITLEELKTLPAPYVVFLNKNGGTFALIKTASDNTVEWLDTQKGWVKNQWEEFTKDWSGIVLLAEPDDNSGEADFESKRKTEVLNRSRIPIAIGLLGILIVWSVVTLPIQSILTYALFLLKLVGMTVATLLFIKTTDTNNRFIDKLCNAGPKVNCNSILDSPAAKITSWFSWSDAGFIYFFGSFFALLFSSNSSETLNAFFTVQSAFSAMAMVFASYSLYYQGAKAKTWCLLCLGVVGVFVMEAIVVTTNFYYNGFLFELLSISTIFLSFLIPITFLLLFKNMVRRAQESKMLNKELTKLKSDPKIFESLMDGQQKMPELPSQMPVVLLGNKSARHTITFVSKPLCNPCADMHIKIEGLLKVNENINCQVVFISNPDKNNPIGQFVRKVFSLPQKLQSQALQSWYEKRDRNFEIWHKQYSEYDELEGLTRVQEGHNYWVNKAEIDVTPTIFINGRLLPEIIDVEDLPLLLRHFDSTVTEYGFANHST